MRTTVGVARASSRLFVPVPALVALGGHHTSKGWQRRLDVDNRHLGVVVQHYYHDPAWPPSQWVPYQIKLADGSGSSDDERLVWAPVDENDCVRAALFAPSFFDDKN